MVRSSQRYRSRKDPQLALRRKLKELASTHVRYGYRRLTVLLRRQRWKVNAKRIYRLYTEGGLIVRTKQRKKIARRQRGAMPAVLRPGPALEHGFPQRQAGRRAWVSHPDRSRSVQPRVCVARGRPLHVGGQGGGSVAKCD